MYCPTCGSEVGEGLRFCNRCGGNLIAETSAAPRVYGLLITLAVAVLLIGVVGLSAIFFFAVEFLGRGNIAAEVVLFLIVFTLVFFGIMALLIWQVSRLTGVYLQSGTSMPEPKAKRAIIQPNPQNQLDEAKQSFVRNVSPPKTDTDTAELATRILPDEQMTTRKLENER